MGKTELETAITLSPPQSFGGLAKQPSLARRADTPLYVCPIQAGYSLLDKPGRQTEQQAAAKRARRETAARNRRSSDRRPSCRSSWDNNMQRAGTEIQGVTNSYIDAIKTVIPDL